MLWSSLDVAVVDRDHPSGADHVEHAGHEVRAAAPQRAGLHDHVRPRLLVVEDLLIDPEVQGALDQRRSEPESVLPRALGAAAVEVVEAPDHGLEADVRGVVRRRQVERLAIRTHSRVRQRSAPRARAPARATLSRSTRDRDGGRSPRPEGRCAGPREMRSSTGTSCRLRKAWKSSRSNSKRRISTLARPDYLARGPRVQRRVVVDAERAHQRAGARALEPFAGAGPSHRGREVALAAREAGLPDRAAALLRLHLRHVVVPGDVPVPGIANDGEHGQVGEVVRQLLEAGAARQVVGNERVRRQVLEAELAQEAAAGARDVQEDEVTRHQHRDGAPGVVAVRGHTADDRRLRLRGHRDHYRGRKGPGRARSSA